MPQWQWTSVVELLRVLSSGVSSEQGEIIAKLLFIPLRDAQDVQMVGVCRCCCVGGGRH